MTAKKTPKSTTEDLPVLIDLESETVSVLGSEQKAGDQPPTDPLFFSTLRLLMANDPFNDPYSQHPTVYSSNNAIAAPLSQVPFRIFKEEGTSQTDANARLRKVREAVPFFSEDTAGFVASLQNPHSRFVEIRKRAPWLNPHQITRAMTAGEIVESGPWYELFKAPNPMLTPAQLWQATALQMNIRGAAFWKLEGRDGQAEENEIPREIWVHSPKGWEPTISEETKLIDGWIHTWTPPKGSPKKDVRTLASTLHFRHYNPDHPIKGLSPLKPLTIDLEQDFNASLFNLAFFKNGAHPGGYLISEKKVTPEQGKKLVEQFEERHKGTRKAWRPDIYSGGIKFVEARTNHRDMEFSKLKEMVRQAIWSAYRTPKSVQGLTEDVNRASATAAIRTFWETVLIPLGQYFEDTMNAHLFTDERTGGTMWGAFDYSGVDALREDLLAKAEAAELLTKVGAPYNEVIANLEMPLEPKPWGDSWYRPATLVPVNEAETAPEPPKDPPSEPSEPEPEPEPDEGQEGAKRPETVNARKQRLLMRKDLRARWDQINEQLSLPNIGAFSRRLGNYFRKLRQEQLILIAKADMDTISVAEQLLFDLEVWKERLTERTRPLWVRLIAQTEDFTDNELEDLGKSVKALPDTAKDELVVNLSNHISKSVSTVHDGLKSVFAEILAEGGTKEDLRKATKTFFTRLTSEGRLGGIATVNAGNGISSTRDLVFKSKGVKEHEWVTAADELVRENHTTYESQGPVPIGTNFAEFTGGAYTLKRPHDSRAPLEETMNCRCAAIPTE